jgi:uncharacterized protein
MKHGIALVSSADCKLFAGLAYRAFRNIEGKCIMRQFVLLIAVLLTGSIQSAWPASFNCRPYISTGQCPEALICTERTLSELDDVLASLYFGARSKMQEEQLIGFRDYQREWLAKRNGCGCNYQCLKSEYETQIEGLRKSINEMR